MLEITDSLRTFILTKQEANDLELKLNVTEYGHTWKHIGDALFDYSTSRVSSVARSPFVADTAAHGLLASPKSQKQMEVKQTYILNEKQYDFLLMLMKKNGYQDCRGLK